MRNFLENILKKIGLDKKHHDMLGSTINPFIYAAVILLLLHFNLSTFYSSIWYGFIGCILFHLGIEVYQKVFKKGQAEVLDFLFGIRSAVNILILLLSINFILNR